MNQMPTRPECWDFAMSFLGDPEAPILTSHLTELEAWGAEMVAERQRLHELIRAALDADECDLILGAALADKMRAALAT